MMAKAIMQDETNQDQGNQPEDNQNPATVDNDLDTGIDPLMRDFEDAKAEVDGVNNTGDNKSDDDHGKAEAMKSQESEENTGSVTPAEGEKPAENASGEANSEAEAKGDGVMIPKPRFDEVLKKSSELQAQVDYLNGVTVTQQQMLQQSQRSQQTLPNAQGEQQQNANVQPPKDLNAQITELEDKKLELAEKYDEGEMSTKDYEAENIKIDREIRNRVIEQSTHVAESAKQQAQAASQQQIMQQTLNNTAAQLMENHPYVKEIDSLPNSDGAWEYIASIARTNLMQRGINPQDGSVQSQLAFMQEKAALTDQHGAYLTGKQLANQNGSNQESGKGGLTEKQQQRLDKVNLSQQQPPSASGVTNGEQQQVIDENRINEMSMDDIAALPDHVRRKFMET
jgi:hypothetical protein